MKKFLRLSSLLLICASSCPVAGLFARGGGDAALGGLAGGMMGSIVGNAMTRESSPSRVQVVETSSSSSVSREIDKLENAVRHDLSKLDERVRVLEREGGSDSSDEVKQEIAAVKKSVKKVESNFESKIEALEDRLDSIEKELKKVAAKIKKSGDGEDTKAKKESVKE